MKYYSQLSLEHIENELPMIKGWALIAHALENDGWLQFGGITAKDGFVKREIDKLMEIQRIFMNNQKKDLN